ncbi:MAG TPA: hypothetical protein VLV90_06765 [Burkholderiales bacterium]|nr:hypothetical protein [Burkholderiales bacterium]
MAIAARWIRMHPPGLAALNAACAGFARAQAADAPPAALWGRCGDDRHALAVVAPLKFLPGRDTRWRGWLLAPLVATYRQCGLSAYADAERICLSGRPISGVDATAIGACGLVVADFAAWGAAFMDALRRRVEAQYGWQFDHSWPTERERDAIAAALAAEPAHAT